MRAFCWWLAAVAAVAAVALCAGQAAAWPAPAGEDADLSNVDPPTPSSELDALGTTLEPEGNPTAPELDALGTTLEPEGNPTAPELDALGTTLEPEGNATAPEALHAGPRVLRRLENGSMPHDCSGEFTCIPKCCPVGQTYQNAKCVPTPVPFNPFIANYSNVKDGLDFLDWPQGSFALVIGNPCKQWTYVNYTEIDMWSNGQLFLYQNQHTDVGDILQPFEFCLEHSERDTEAIFCIEPEQSVQRGFANWLYTFGMLVSVSGLLLTLFVYLAVDALRDLHGKSLIFHVGCLAIAYSLLAAVQLSGDTNFGPFVCRRMAFAIQFFLLASFLWLHVMCLDAFWGVLEATGCSPIPYPRAKKWEWDKRSRQWVAGLNLNVIDDAKEEDRKRRDKRVERRVFVGYSLYVWILTILPVLVVVTRGLSPTIPATYLDQNMKEHCELHEDLTKESFLYFYPFTAMVIILNVMIFICILIKAVPFKWNLSGPQRVPKQKARMCFLLFVLMSSNWIIDLISWALGGKQFVWVMLHAFYILQGLITFLIFVLEDRVKDRIVHKLWPGVRRISSRYGCCCHQSVQEEESIALRSIALPSNSQPLGWVQNSQ